MKFAKMINCAIVALFGIMCLGSIAHSKIVDFSFRNLKKEDFFVKLQTQIDIHEVTVLKLEGNQFDNFVDCSTNLENLEVLDLSQNHLEKFFFLCRTEYNLQVLNISHNKLEYVDDNALNFRMSKLKTLDISNNRMIGVNDTMLEHMRKLEFLSFANNPIEDNMDEAALWNLESLKTLNLRNISATFFSPVMFQALTNLTHLDLSMNPMEVVPILPTSIEFLDLSGTNLLNLGNLILPNLKNLQMNNMQNLTTALLNYFENLTKLETLSMARCTKLSKLKVWPPNDRLLPQLEHLSVQNCALDTLNVELRPILQRTPILDLENNPWNCDCRLKWVHSINLTSDPKHGITCRYPSRLRNKILVHLSENELLCEDESNVTSTVLWSCFSIFMIVCAIVGIVFLLRSSMGKWTMIRKGRSRDTVSYANVVESSNDLVRILSDGETIHRNDE